MATPIMSVMIAINKNTTMTTIEIAIPAPESAISLNTPNAIERVKDSTSTMSGHLKYFLNFDCFFLFSILIYIYNNMFLYRNQIKNKMMAKNDNKKIKF